MQQKDVPYTVRLDQERAKQLVRQGGTLLLLDVPEGTVVGLDQQVFVVGPRFKGVKMLPPGPHLLTYNAADRQGEFSPTTSFFVYVRPSMVAVRRWDPESELLLDLADEDEAERYAAGVRRMDFDDGLAPYDFGSFAAWQRLSSYIDANTIARVAPVSGGDISITAEADPAARRVVTEAEDKLEEQLREGRRLREERSRAAPMDVEEGTEDPAHTSLERGSEEGPGTSGRAGHLVERCRFTRLPRLAKGRGGTAAALTAANLDKSFLLEGILEQAYEGREAALLGELQFAFLAFLLGQSLEAYGQWKAMLQLLLACEAAPLGPRAALFASFLGVLRAQLETSMGDAAQLPAAGGHQPFGLPMVEELMGDSFLRHGLRQFLECLRDAGPAASANLQAEAERLRSLVGAKLGWQFDVTELGGGSDDEYDPVVIEL